MSDNLTDLILALAPDDGSSIGNGAMIALLREHASLAQHAVDDTAHFLARYGSERNRGATPELAAARCGRYVGRPIAITSVMLVVGFSIVALSSARMHLG